MPTPPEPYNGYPPPPPGGYPGGYYRHPAATHPPGYPLPQATNSLAIVSLVCAFLFAPLGVVFGHMALSQIRKTGEEGRGMAIAGLVISYLVLAFTVLVIVVSVVFLMVVAQERTDGPRYWNATAGVVGGVTAGRTA